MRRQARPSAAMEDGFEEHDPRSMFDASDAVLEMEAEQTPTRTPRRGRGALAAGQTPDSDRGQREVLCPDPECGEPRKKGGRFCVRKERFYQVMKTQAKKNSQLEDFMELMKPADVALVKVHEFMASNISVREREVKKDVNWLEFFKTRGKRLEDQKHKQNAPIREE